MKIRVGLVGLGDHWDDRHRPALIAMSDRFEVKAVCCQIAERSKKVSDIFQAAAVDGFRAITERNDIDAVLVLSPDWVGPLPMIAACEAGKAVYCSTALDLTPEQALDIRKRIDISGVAFMAEFPRRYSPATLRLKELIATRLGPVKMLFCHDRMPMESQPGKFRQGEYCPLAWRHLMEQVDWCRYIVGADPHSVLSASFNSENSSDSFYQMVSLEFPSSDGNGHPLAQLSLGHYIPRRWKDALSFRRPASIQVCCENGMAFLDLPSSLVWFDDAGQHTEALHADRPVGEQMLAQFYRSVTSLVRKQADLNDAYRAMQIVFLSNQSVINGQRMKIEFGV